MRAIESLNMSTQENQRMSPECVALSLVREPRLWYVKYLDAQSNPAGFWLCCQRIENLTENDSLQPWA